MNLPGHLIALLLFCPSYTAEVIDIGRLTRGGTGEWLPHHAARFRRNGTAERPGWGLWSGSVCHSRFALCALLSFSCYAFWAVSSDGWGFPDQPKPVLKVWEYLFYSPETLHIVLEDCRWLHSSDSPSWDWMNLGAEIRIRHLVTLPGIIISNVIVLLRE